MHHSSPPSKLAKETPQATCAETSECDFLLGAGERRTGVVDKRSGVEPESYLQEAEDGQKVEFARCHKAERMWQGD